MLRRGDGGVFGLARFARTGWLTRFGCHGRLTRMRGGRGFLRRNHAFPLKLAGTRGRRDRRMAIVLLGGEFRVLGGRRDLSGLRRRHRNVMFLLSHSVRGARLRPESAGPAIVADLRMVDDVDVASINVCYVRRTKIVYGAVVDKVVTLPTAALIAAAAITIAIIDAAIITDVTSPIAIMEDISAIEPTPPRWSPQHGDFRRLNPGSRYPIITRVLGPGPIPRGPDVAHVGYRRLLVNRQHRRRELD
jgi:hypothetical protein